MRAPALNRLNYCPLEIHQKTTPGETGLEPATPGFGDRCTTNCATRLLQINTANSQLGKPRRGIHFTAFPRVRYAYGSADKTCSNATDPSRSSYFCWSDNCVLCIHRTPASKWFDSLQPSLKTPNPIRQVRHFTSR